MRSGRVERAAKRERLVAAAADVLRAEGVAGCTARAVAARAGLSKSAIHYYLEDVDELVDLAFRRLMGEFIGLMERRAAAAPVPSDRVWAAAAVYVRLGTSRDRRVPMMTFDVLINASRQDRLDALAPIMEAIVAVVRRLVHETGCENADAKANVLMSALIGVLVRAELSARPLDEAFAELAAVVGLPPPSRSVAELDPPPEARASTARRAAAGS